MLCVLHLKQPEGCCMARRKSRNGKNQEIEFLTKAIQLNSTAVLEGPKRKHWSPKDIKKITPLTPTQEETFHSWYNNQNLCLYGSAGTGKTFLAMYLALEEILAKHQNRIIIIRSAVPTREMGFLPGTLEEKMAQFELPYYNIFHELLGKSSSYQDMKDAGLVEFMSTSYIRGLTWDNAIVILEEVENMTFHEIDSVITRTGENTRVIFAGDIKQSDLVGTKRQGESGMQEALKILCNMDEFDCVAFTTYDIVRGPLVKAWIEASEHAA